VVSTTPRPHFPRERPGTHCIGGWVGPRVCLDVCEKSRPHRFLKLNWTLFIYCGPGYRGRYNDCLRAGWSRDRIQVDARFSALVQKGPGAHLTFYAAGSWSFPRVKRSGRDVNNPPLSSAEVEERVEQYLCFPFGPSRQVIWLTLPCLYYPVAYYNTCIYAI
jgi:hypothetical protein